MRWAGSQVRSEAGPVTWMIFAKAEALAASSVSIFSSLGVDGGDPETCWTRTETAGRERAAEAGSEGTCRGADWPKRSSRLALAGVATDGDILGQRTKNAADRVVALAVISLLAGHANARSGGVLSHALHQNRSIQ